MMKKIKTYMCIGSVCLLLTNLGGCAMYKNSLSLDEQIKEVEYFLKDTKEAENLRNNSKIVESVLDNILSNYENSSQSSDMEIKNDIAYLYILKGNYAKAIEECMGIIALSERNNDEVAKAKAYTNMGMVYSILDNAEQSLIFLNKALEINSNDPKKNAHLKTYILNNLYYALVSQEQYDKILDVNTQMNEYMSYISEESINEVTIINDIMLSLYYLHSEDKDLTKAEKLLTNVKPLIGNGDKYSKQFILDFYNKATGDLLYSQGNISESIDYYKKLADSEDEHLRSYVKKETIDQLIKVYRESNDYVNAKTYIDKLQDQYTNEAQIVNNDYSEYALYKYEYKNNLKKMADEKLKRYIIMLSAVFSTVSIATILYMKYFKLKKINKIDALTKAYNRRFFEIKYKQLMNSDKNFSIIMIDIDNFKKINDTYGHHFGDKVLKSTVEKVKEIIKIDESIFRYGGEEFSILLEEVDKDKLSKIAEDILENVRTIKYDKDKFATISMGIACSSDTMRDILEIADSNLYKSKTSGKDKFTIS